MDPRRSDRGRARPGRHGLGQRDRAGDDLLRHPAARHQLHAGATERDPARPRTAGSSGYLLGARRSRGARGRFRRSGRRGDVRAVGRHGVRHLRRPRRRRARLFLVFNPDHPSKDADREPFSVSLFLHTFWINPVRHPDFFWAFTGRLLLYTGYFGVLGYQLYILQDYIGLGADAAAAVPVAGLLNLAGIIVSTAVCGPISDRFGGRRKPFVFASSLIVAIALVIPMVSHTYGAWLLLSAIAGVGFGAFSAVDQALMADVLPSASSYAKDLGVVNIAATLPQVIAPAVAGAVILLFGGYLALFPIGIVLSVLGAFAVWFIKGVR
ncbi:hypothetical protein DEJ16_05890 [Curtobacterium sp. MCJR17_055]|nr:MULTISPECIES: MFS transporter [unclassified Curtobacterium]PYY37864.1 hypothetical protein DEI87_01645 [Curtobacterium sp. MCBD17_029]PYY56890.1 hypothetical protein DEJ16_05890 [Curtobacterium sp. MCJR17_055]PYY62194.1 hypothetical protein DEJ26_01635 [Curtobacterium sp. MCPF17_015]